jgi:DNA-binding MarR family transcriptional regulator
MNSHDDVLWSQVDADSGRPHIHLPPSYGGLLALLADGERHEILATLLAGSASQRDLRAKLGLQSGTVSRQLKDLEQAGLVVRDRSHGPYELTRPIETRALLLAAAELARAISSERAHVDAVRASELGEL